MKIAYIILTHKDPKLLKKLCDHLTEDKKNYCFIHVDNKINIKNFSNIKENKNIHFVKKRVSISWSAWSYTEACLNAIKEAKKCDEFQRYVFLQGLDYPTKSNKEIRHFFEKNKNVEFIIAMEINKKNSRNEKSKFDMYLYIDEKNILEKGVNFFVKVIKKLKLNFPVRKMSIIESGIYE